MKKHHCTWGMSIILLLSLACINQPKDIRNDFLKTGITEESKRKGMQLLQKMEDAYGGRNVWDSLSTGEFIQIADWYGRTPLAHWDTLPQRYRLLASLGTNDCELELLNGPNAAQMYQIAGEEFWQKYGVSEWENLERNSYYEKMIFKNYWFQFPFRIGEASIISFAGKEEIEGKSYDLLYATWGQEEANSTYDQFLLYLNEESHLMEYLYFTVREKMESQGLTARFDSFAQAGPLILPYSQFVSLGKPGGLQIKMHENHYESIFFK